MMVYYPLKAAAAKLRRPRLRHLLLALVSGLGLSGCQPASHVVAFKIENNPIVGKRSEFIKVTRSNLHGGTDEPTARPPYTDSSTITGSGYVAISAMTDDYSATQLDKLSCVITVDGQNLSSSKGAASVSCGGMIH